jgi:ferric-dicitrate binding protein FerR (iron transport regulator)
MMKNKRDIDLISLLQDKTFLDWAKNGDIPESEFREFIRVYPGQEETVRVALEFIKSNRSDQKRLEPTDVSAIWKNIRVYLDKQKGTAMYRCLAVRWAKIAAVVAITISGVAGIYHYYRIDAFRQTVHHDVEAGSEAVIVLSDGTTHRLEETDSNIEYNADGTEIVVKNDAQGQKRLKNTKNNSIGSIVNQVIVPFGRRHGIILSDGTKVQLNSGSSLIFPAEFSKKTRNVYLKGEGYFEISKDSEKPFIVKTDYVELKVLGTTFNISAYGDEQTVSAVLVEGKVKVSHKNKFLGTTESELEPGQGYFYSVDRSAFEIKDVDLEYFISWKDGVFQFKDMSLSDVVKRVRKYYNQSIRIEGETLANTLISGKLVLSEDFNDVMKFLSKTIEGRYEETQDLIYILKY